MQVEKSSKLPSYCVRNEGQMNFTAVKTEEVHRGHEVRHEEADDAFHAFFAFQLYYGLYGFTGFSVFGLTVLELVLPLLENQPWLLHWSMIGVRITSTCFI